MRYLHPEIQRRRARPRVQLASLPAQEIERVVVDEIRGLASDRDLLNKVLKEAQSVLETERSVYTQERHDLLHQIGGDHKALRRLVEQREKPSDFTARLAELNDRIASSEQRVPELDARLAELEREVITPTHREWYRIWGQVRRFTHLSPFD
ncbi:MAG: hypothetical protein JKX70_11565 [Phycisphaerales bacterium]|nr:hypothetical protein [Phycisphaerales bacterium]